MSVINKISAKFRENNVWKYSSIITGVAGASFVSLPASSAFVTWGIIMLGSGALFELLSSGRKSEIKKLSEYITYRSDKIEQKQYFILILLLTVFLKLFSEEIKYLLKFSIYTSIFLGLVFILILFSTTNYSKLEKKLLAEELLKKEKLEKRKSKTVSHSTIRMSHDRFRVKRNKRNYFNR